MIELRSECATDKLGLQGVTLDFDAHFVGALVWLVHQRRTWPLTPRPASDPRFRHMFWDGVVSALAAARPPWASAKRASPSCTISVPTDPLDRPSPDPDEEFTVQVIVKHRWERKPRDTEPPGWRFLIKVCLLLRSLATRSVVAQWKGYGPSENSWEPISCFNEPCASDTSQQRPRLRPLLADDLVSSYITEHDDLLADFCSTKYVKQRKKRRKEAVSTIDTETPPPASPPPPLAANEEDVPLAPPKRATPAAAVTDLPALPPIRLPKIEEQEPSPKRKRQTQASSPASMAATLVRVKPARFKPKASGSIGLSRSASFESRGAPSMTHAGHTLTS
jgi:hypothetical protein